MTESPSEVESVFTSPLSLSFDVHHCTKWRGGLSFVNETQVQKFGNRRGERSLGVISPSLRFESRRYRPVLSTYCIKV